MRSRPIAVLLILAWVVFVTGAAHAQGTRHDTSTSQPSEATVQAIVSCLSQGREAVMVPHFHCEAYGVGAGFAQSEKMPVELSDADWNEVCRNKDDPRHLPGDIIKRIAARKDAIAPSGIRIIGGIFCGDIDLVGLDLPYSVVIDYALVNGDLDARNLRIRGDLSFEHTLILGNLLLNRAHVDGSVYGGSSFIDQLLVNDSLIDGTWWQSDSVMLSDTQFHRSSFSGDLRLDNSAFTQLSVLSSNIGGTLGLNNSEARCAYHINSSSMNYFSASGAGFGRMQAVPQEANIEYPWWDRTLSLMKTRQLFDSPAAQPMVAAALRLATAPRPHRVQRNPASGLMRGCERTSGSAYAEFYLFDSNVRSASCITLFAWLAPKQPRPTEADPVSILALNGTRVAGNLIVDLAGTAGANPPPGTDGYKLAVGKHKLEAIGASAGALIYNFDDGAAPYFTYIDGLNFDRIHNAAPACTGDMVQLATQVELPSSDKVLHWLEKNKAPSSQPFAAFAAAFERAGESAVNLRVGRQTYDLCAKTAQFATLRWLAAATGQCPDREESADPAPTAATQQDLAQHPRDIPARGSAPSPGILESITSNGVDLAMLAFNWGLYGLADYGLRPAKVVWSILITVVVFALWFWLRLRVVGFEPKREDGAPAAAAPDIWPLGFLFLFDRLLPVYHIRDEHHTINKFYRRATRGEIKAASAGRVPQPMSVLGCKVSVMPITEAQTRRVEKWLVVLRVIGAIFTIFLVAAIASLTK
jgi:hypothetical protein